MIYEGRPGGLGQIYDGAALFCHTVWQVSVSRRRTGGGCGEGRTHRKRSRYACFCGECACRARAAQCFTGSGKSPDISNGRFEIFQDYINAIRFRGHPKMGPEDPKGDEYAHAHNSYLQVAYNFGLVAGLLFLVLCALTLWRAVRLFLDYGSRYSIVLIPFSLVVVFGFISLTEWAYHPCIPAGFGFILMQMLLMRDCEGPAK